MSQDLTQMRPPMNTFNEVITPGRFAGKTVIVTGAGSGIGKAVALRMAKEGGKVVAADWSPERLDLLKAEHPDLAFVTVAGDISKEEDAQAIAAAALAIDGKIDSLINNAGIMDEFAPVHEVTDEVWARVFRVNVEGMMRVSRAVVPHMLEAKKGTIVNTASEAGLRGSAAGVAYTASKHAVVGITRNCAVIYHGTGIRVNAVAPGAVATNIGGKFSSQMAAARIGPLIAATMGNIATPEELAALITFLASDDSSNVSGAIVTSDGGWSAI